LRTATQAFTGHVKRRLNLRFSNVFIDATKSRALKSIVQRIKKLSFCELLYTIAKQDNARGFTVRIQATSGRCDTSKTKPFTEAERHIATLQNEPNVWKNGFMFVEKLSKRCCITTWVLYKYSD
jgi:DUF1009 family protein